MIQYTIQELKQACREDRLASFFRLKTKEGIYEVRINEIAIFSTLIEKTSGSEPEWWEGARMLLPKVDTAHLMQIIGSFQKIYRYYGPVEAVAHIFWSPEKKSYYVHYPKQVVSGVDIHIEWDNERMEKDILVVEVHSHHIMKAFFSETDDEYEKAARFYAVVGKIDKFFPDVKLRYANARMHREIPLETVFESRFPMGWLDNITIRGGEK